MQCQPKLCATQINNVVQATTTTYWAGQYAIAYVTNNNGASYTTTVAASQCSAYAQVSFANYDCNTLTPCGGGTTTTPTPVPVPVPAALTCEAKPCTTLGSPNGNTYVTLTEGTSYAFTEYARLTVNNQVTSTPASLCAVLTTPAQWAFAPSVACGTDGGGEVTTTATCTGGGGEVLTYTYTTQGSTVVVATTLPCRGGPFHLTGSGSNIFGGERGKLLFHVWMVGAIVAGVGMIIL